MISIRRTVTMGLGAALVGASLTLSLAAPAQASDGGPVCFVDRNTQVFDGPGSGDRIYTIQAGGGFRLHEIRSDGYALGHGNGHTDGYIRWDDGRLWC